MSKGDFGYGSTVAASYQRPGGIDQFQSIFNETSNLIFRINKNVSTLESLSKSFSTHSGPKDAEEKIHSISQVTNKLAKESKNKFKSMSAYLSNSANYQYDPQGNKLNQNKLQQGKLKQEFENSLSRYQAIQNTLSIKLKTHIDEDLHLSPSKQDSSDLLDDSSDQAQLIDYDEGQAQRQAQLQAQQQAEEEELEAIKERESRIRQVETDILDVNEIFRDLAVIIHEQGDTIDSIEGNVEQAVVHVKQANVQLQRAKDYQKSARKRLCIIFVVVFVTAGIIGLIIYLSSGK